MFVNNEYREYIIKELDTVFKVKKICPSLLENSSRRLEIGLNIKIEVKKSQHDFNFNSITIIDLNN